MLDNGLRASRSPRPPDTSGRPMSADTALQAVPLCGDCGHYWPEHFEPVRGKDQADQRACRRRLPDTTGSQCSCRAFRAALPGTDRKADR